MFYLRFGKCYLRAREGSGEGQIMVRSGGQVKVQSQKFSELDIGGRDT